ncbi:putative D-serine dehydratase domain protein, partial [Vibrio parahaemolyticus V-223/04]
MFFKFVELVNEKAHPKMS